MLKTLSIALALCYPFAVYWGLQVIDARLLLLVLLGVLVVRWLCGAKITGKTTVLISIVGICLVALIGGAELSLKVYPALVNLALLLLFAGSLRFTPTIVERIARIKQPDLNDAGVAYTRKVTVVWCVFFFLNGCAAVATTLIASEEVWLLYNGLIAYLLIGLLFSIEWIIRQRIMGRSDA